MKEYDCQDCLWWDPDDWGCGLGILSLAKYCDEYDDDWRLKEEYQ